MIDNQIKLAWFGEFGTILMHNFAILDENDAYKYDKAINTV